MIKKTSINIKNMISTKFIKLINFLKSKKVLGLGSIVSIFFASINTSANAVDLTGNDIYADGVSNATGSVTDPSVNMAMDLKEIDLIWSQKGQFEAN